MQAQAFPGEGGPQAWGRHLRRASGEGKHRTHITEMVLWSVLWAASALIVGSGEMLVRL